MLLALYALPAGAEAVYTPQVYGGTVSVYTGYMGEESYFDVNVTGTPPGYVPADGGYRGWCMRQDIIIAGNTWYNHSLLYSTLEPWTIPDHGDTRLKDARYNETNYILNQWASDPREPPYSGATWKDVQQAIWVLNTPGYRVNYATPYGSWARVQAIVEDARLNGVDYVPGPGEYMAVLLVPRGPEMAPLQPIIITVPIPPGGYVPDFVIPEVPLGSLSAALAPLTALAAAGLMGKRRR